MNKIKFLKFDSLCLLAVYPPTVVFDYIYEMYGGKIADILPEFCF